MLKVNVNIDAWIKLVCSVYLTKHKTLFNSESITSLYAALMITPLTDEKVQLLKWLAYDNIVPLRTIYDWHDFTRRICFYHSSGSKDHESLLIPTVSALRYHMLRSEYVLKIVLVFSDSTNIDPCKYGWNIDTNIQIVWDDEESMKAVQTSKVCGCKGAKCDGSTPGCRNCFKMCKPCISKCKCKGNCKNPHNNGGKCPNCEVQEESDGDVMDTDDEQPSEILPLVTRSSDIIDFDADSDNIDTDDEA